MATTTEELNIRVGVLANEVEGEKAVTRYAFEQVRLNTDELTSFRAEARLRLDRIGADMALVKGAQVAQGGTLNILLQDVREMRLDVIAVRRDVEQANVRLDRVEARLDRVEARLDGVDERLDKVEAQLDRLVARLDGVDQRLDQVDARLGRLVARLDGVDQRLDQVDARLGRLEARLETRFDQMQEGITAILAAVSPRSPA